VFIAHKFLFLKSLISRIDYIFCIYICAETSTAHTKDPLSSTLWSNHIWI